MSGILGSAFRQRNLRCRPVRLSSRLFSRKNVIPRKFRKLCTHEIWEADHTYCPTIRRVEWQVIPTVEDVSLDICACRGRLVACIQHGLNKLSATEGFNRASTIEVLFRIENPRTLYYHDVFECDPEYY